MASVPGRPTGYVDPSKQKATSAAAAAAAEAARKAAAEGKSPGDVATAARLAREEVIKKQEGI